MMKNGMRFQWLWPLVAAVCLCLMAHRPALAVGPYVGDGQTVLDQATGLEWQQADNGAWVNWQGAMDYCEGLDLGGHTDWRLPTIRELHTIVDYSRLVPTIDTNVFQGRSAEYWSSTVSAIFSSDAWLIDFGDGTAMALDKSLERQPISTEGRYARCVRTETSGMLDPVEPGPFAIVNQQILLDQATGLMWQRGDSGQLLTWLEAISYCENLSLDGYADWRLPAVEQLHSLYDFRLSTPTWDTLYRPGAGNGYVYWSATSVPGYMYMAWGFELYEGHAIFEAKLHDNYSATLPTRCVRGSAGGVAVDLDGDGWPAGLDADDTDSTVYPGAPELCDNKDNDQNGWIDGQIRTTTCGVGVCSGNTGTETCTAGIWGGDTCNPVMGGVPEAACDGIDNDCDGQIDEIPALSFYPDADHDGFGDSLSPIETCNQPAGYVADGRDCDDSSAAINPAAVDKTVDGIDQNCDGIDGLAPGTTLAFPAIKDGVYSDGLWLNFISIQAKDPSVPVNVLIKLYNTDGSLRFETTDVTPVNGSLVKTPNWLVHAALDREKFSGTVVVEAEAPILGMTNLISPGENSYETYEAPVPRASLFFPAAFDNYNVAARKGYQNIIHLQNVNADPVTVTVTYVDDFAGTFKDVYVIPGHGEYERNVREVFGGSFNGSISVSATGDLAGILRHEYCINGAPISMAMYEGTVERSEIFYPYINDGGNLGKTNWYSIMNPSSSVVACTLDFYSKAGDTGAGPVFSENFTVSPGGRHITTPSWARYGDLTHYFTGSIAGTCSAPVMSIINVVEPVVTVRVLGNNGCLPGDCIVILENVVTSDINAFNDYEANQPRDILVFPQVYDNVGGYINELHLQNTNPFPVTVNLDLYFNTGELLGSSTQVIGPYAKYIVRPYTLNQTLNTPGSLETNGSLRVTVDGGNAISGVMSFRKGTFVSIYEAVSP